MVFFFFTRFVSESDLALGSDFWLGKNGSLRFLPQNPNPSGRILNPSSKFSILIHLISCLYIQINKINRNIAIKN